MKSQCRHDAVLAGFILCSLLFHLLLLSFLSGRSVTDGPRQEPIVVEVRSSQTRDRELDLPVLPEPPAPRETPAERLGPSDQLVPKEVAPPGEAPEDRQPVAPAPPPVPAPPAATPVPEPSPAPEAIDLGLPQDTLARLQDETRRRQRDDVAPGDQVWLDTERDFLISFFDRFRRNIYNVWNYPPQAITAREQGVAMLKIVINRDGSVDGVEILRSSGFPTLDREAVAAVYRGASYGALPAAYTEENLVITAYFQYRLSLSGLRGGDIFEAR